MENKYTSHKYNNLNIDMILKRMYQDYDSYDQERRNKMHEAINKYNAMSREYIQSVGNGILDHKKCKSIYEEMRNELDSIVNERDDATAQNIIDMLEKGRSGRVLFKGSIGNLVDSLSAAANNAKENEDMIEINSVPDFWSDADTDKEDENIETSISQNGHIYKPMPKTVNPDRKSDIINELLLKEHLKDLKRIDTLTRIIEEYMSELKELKHRVDILENLVKES